MTYFSIVLCHLYRLLGTKWQHSHSQSCFVTVFNLKKFFLTNTKTEPQVNETEKGCGQVGGIKQKHNYCVYFFIPFLSIKAVVLLHSFHSPFSLTTQPYHLHTTVLYRVPKMCSYIPKRSDELSIPRMHNLNLHTSKTLG